MSLTPKIHPPRAAENGPCIERKNLIIGMLEQCKVAQTYSCRGVR